MNLIASSEILVTGFSGRFPASDSVADFWKNLCDGKDLVSATSRYPKGFHGLPGRQAEIRAPDKFDAMFFGISAKQADCLDPQIRLLLEVVFEAIVDAGYAMEDLAGSSTGVYIGGCFSDLHKAMLKDLRSICGYENTGCSHSMFANRVSFCFDLRGPSMTIDTACSSSLVAFDSAVRDIRSGRITRAIVGGVSIAVDPGISKSFQAYNMLSPSGKCQSFDAKADGYVRADAVGAVLIESSAAAATAASMMRIPQQLQQQQQGAQYHSQQHQLQQRVAAVGYMRVLGTGCNSDGWKSAGITYPSAQQQIALCESVCAEYGIDPLRVGFIEAHGTGTVAGDRQELHAIDQMFGSDSCGALIGSIKSNMGHSEGASGIMALIKVLGVLAEGVVPGNLHFESTTHVPILSGRLKVATQCTPFNSLTASVAATAAVVATAVKPLVAINNFGFGGTNAHVVGISGCLPTAAAASEEAAVDDAMEQLLRPSTATTTTSIATSISQDSLYAADVAADVTTAVEMLPTSMHWPPQSAVVHNNNCSNNNSNNNSSEGFIDVRQRWLFARNERCLKQYAATAAEGSLGAAAWRKMMRSSCAIDKFPWRAIVDPPTAATTVPTTDTATAIATNTITATACTSTTEKAPAVAAAAAVELSIEMKQAPSSRVPIAFCYTGQGCQWASMARDLWLNESIFRDTITDACACLQQQLSVSLHQLFTAAGSDSQWLDSKWSGLGITLVQLGLTALLKSSGLQPDFIFGHSVGEVACGYADGCTSAAEAARIAFVRCQLSEKISAHGLMLAAGLTLQQARELISSAFPQTVVACYNSPDGVTLSGPAADIRSIEKLLKERDTFARIVDTDGVAYHSTFFQQHVQQIEKELAAAITDPPIPRSSKWLSTSSSNSNSSSDNSDSSSNSNSDNNSSRNSSSDNSTYADAAYHARNVSCMVNFAPVAASLPAGTIVLEIGPHGLLQSMLKRCNGSIHSLPLMRRGEDGNITLRNAMDALWLRGAAFQFAKESYVVPPSQRVQLRWDHDVSWRIPRCSDFSSTAAAASAAGSAAVKVTYDLLGADSYLLQHVIDGRSLFPAMGHVCTAWQANPNAAAGSDATKQPLHCREIRILRAVLLDGMTAITFTVLVQGLHWTITHDGSPCATGEFVLISTAAGGDAVAGAIATTGAVVVETLPCSVDAVIAATVLAASDAATEAAAGVSGSEMYASLARYGYEYADEFQLVQWRSADARCYRLRPTSHWIAYLDNVLQASVCLKKLDALKLPTKIAEVQIAAPLLLSTAASAVVVSRPHLDAVGNDAVLIRGLQTTLSRKSHKVATTNAIEFVPYGEHLYSYHEEYKLRLLQLLIRCFWNAHATVASITATSDAAVTAGVKDYAFMQKMAALTPSLLPTAATTATDGDCLAELQQLQLEHPHTQLAAVAHHVYGDLQATLRNAYFQISTAPGHDDLYALDPSASCAGAAASTSSASTAAAGDGCGCMGLDIIAQIVRSNVAGGFGSKFSVLELGAGSGGLTRQLYPLLANDVSSYTATDVSSIKQHFPAIDCIRYDLNERWTGEKVSLVAASNAVHTGRNLRAVLSNIHDALIDSSEGASFLLLHEYTCLLPVLLWGLDAFAWAAEDANQRDFALWISFERWQLLLRECGFEPMIWYRDSSCHQMLMLAQKVALPATTSVATATTASVATPSIVGDIVVHSRSEILSAAAGTDSSQRVKLCTSDYADVAFVRSLRKEPNFKHCTVELELKESDIIAFSSSSSAAAAVASSENATRCQLPISVRAAGRIGGFHEVPLRIKNNNSSSSSSSYRGQHAQVTAPGNLESLCWVQNAFESNVRVAFCGLNFKDAMLAFGKLSTGGEPVKLGLEFSGTRISKSPAATATASTAASDTAPAVAEVAVIGISSGCMADSLCAEEHLLWELPQSSPLRFDLPAAASIPVVYSTVYYALVCKANLQAGQQVLIHSIAGGVGLAAYHICQHRGARCIVSCSPQKATWVQQQLNIAPELILDSHSCKFRDDVLQLTAGAGVDVVLNSLSGDKLVASVQCVASYGHFCEIGKYDIQQNSAIGLGLFERNVSFHCIDLSDMFDKPKLWQPVHQLLAEGLRSGEVKPLPITVFTDAEQGLRCISTGRHIGKVLVDMHRALPNETRCNNSNNSGSSDDASCNNDSVDDVATSATADLASATTTKESLQRVPKRSLTYRTAGTHIVVGGLGGFGLELVDFLWQHGAEAVIVISRSEPRPWQAQKLNGARVLHCDLIDAAQCDDLIRGITTTAATSDTGIANTTNGAASASAVSAATMQRQPPLRGVWHLGMVLSDRLFANMSAQQWAAAVDVKDRICRNLDASTRSLLPLPQQKQLQFVMWSSVSSLFGNAGQSNYAFANARMEAVCLQRRSDGLHAVAVQWGLIGAVGAMLGKSTNGDFAFRPQHIDACMETLQSTLLHADHAVVTSYLRNDAAAAGDGSNGSAAAMNLSQRVARVLGIDPAKPRSTDTLSALGMDSLQSVEIAAVLAKSGIHKSTAELQVMTWAALEALA